MSKTIPDLIRDQIACRGLKQCVVARRAGFSEQQFTDMLHGRKTIKAEYMPKIAKAIDVNVAELFPDE